MEAAKKLQLITDLLQIEDEATLTKIASMVTEHTKPAKQNEKFAGLAGIWSDEDAAAMKKEIEQAFEQIHPDDWK